MQFFCRPQLYLITVLIISVIGIHSASAQSSGGTISAKAVLDGSLHQISADSSVMVQDSAFFNAANNGNLDTPYAVQNIITLMINEASSVYLHDTFSVSVALRIYYLTPSGATDSVNQTLFVRYDSTFNYPARNTFVFKGSHQVTVKILSVTPSVTSWDPTTALLLENQMTAMPVFKFTCANTVNQIQVNPETGVSNADELPVTWNTVTGADQYDLEWTFVDYSALAAGVYNDSATNVLSPDLIFQNNASRITITGTSYNIPLIYDDSGTVFIRARAVQTLPGNAVLNAQWSSDLPTPVMGQYTWGGHQRNLNWQANISYAEQGKRKVVLQYYDGSLRSRQTVTKDNTTNTTIVGETYYDYQGRPSVQVMPAPTLNTVIAYTANFNTANGVAYSQSNFDTLPSLNVACSIHAAAMDNTAGASLYYSHNNPRGTQGVNQFIPDAQSYPFSETEYTPDATGRINRQGGVGPNYQLGSGHETKYFYGTPSQYELDALFGTEVGNYSHYFKNMVEDANGQFSISYVDMHGRTIATALAGTNPSAQTALPSNTGGSTFTENLLDSSTAVIDNLTISSQRSLLVSSPGNYQFNYSLNPNQDSSYNCSAQKICYTCVYDLEVSITDNCHNQLMPNGVKYDTVIQNLRFDEVTPSMTTTPMALSFTLPLQMGTYTITKKLSVDQNAYVYYRDSVYLPNSVCLSLSQYINNQKTIAEAANNQCTPSCSACLANIGTWPNFQVNFMTQGGIATADTASYRNQALTAYQNALANCDAVCSDSLSDDVDILNAMLADVTPPYGQYADTNTVGPQGLADGFNIFHIPTDGTDTIPVFQLAQITYLDANGNPDSVFLLNSGINVIPGLLSRTQFVQNFKPSWAYQLLPFHPEYCKYQAYLAQRSSNLYDRLMENTQTFEIAYYSGFLNPTGNTSVTLAGGGQVFIGMIDPFSQEQNFGSLLNAKMTTYLQGSNDNPNLSMWGMACAMVKCPTNAQACIDQYAVASKDFDTTSWCEADLDLAWLNFRSLYLQYKTELMNQDVIGKVTKVSSCNGYVNPGWKHPGTVPNQIALFQAGHTAEFNDNTLTASGSNMLNQYNLAVYQQAASNGSSGIAQAEDSVNTGINNFSAHNVNALAQQWAVQLAPCNYSTTALNNTILPELTALCQMGTDSEHPIGASTLPPGLVYTPAGTSYQFTSFQNILAAYNQSIGLVATPTCNPEMITTPQPYSNQAAIGNEPIITAPSACECHQVSRWYFTYLLTNQGDPSFSAYLQRTQQVNMSTAQLNELLTMCHLTLGNPSNTCVTPSVAVYLPPIFQCSSGPGCVPCQVVDSLDNVYRQTYPTDTAMLVDTVLNDTVQYAKDMMYQNFMNNRLGFNLPFSAYLTFIDSCKTIASTLYDSLKCSNNPIGQVYQSSGNGIQFLWGVPTTDGGYIMVGSITTAATGQDAYIAKTDQYGNVTWSKGYGSPGNDYYFRVKQTSDGGYIATGTTTARYGSHYEELITKYDASGNVTWTKIIGFYINGTPTAGEHGWDIIQTSDGGYAALGTYNDAPGSSEVLMSKLDVNGNILWSRYFGGTSSNTASSVYEKGDTLVATGSTWNGSTFYGALYKLNETTGTVVDAQQYEDAQDSSTWFGPIFPITNGYRIYIDHTQGDNNTGQHISYVDIANNDAILHYVETNVPTGNNIGVYGGITKTLDGGTMVAQVGDNVHHVYWQKYDSNGNPQFSRMTNIPGIQFIQCLIQNADSSYTIPGGDNNNGWFIHVDDSARTPCFDSAVTIGRLYPDMGIVPLNQGASGTISTLTSDTTLTQASYTPVDSNIICQSNSNGCYSITNGPLLCGSAAPIFQPAAIDSTSTCSDSLFFATSAGTNLYNNYVDSLNSHFEINYNNNCLAAVKSEVFTVTHVENEYHYTLYYYDQAGNLLKTVPPAGVNPNFRISWMDSVEADKTTSTLLAPANSLVTNYRYNTLNQAVAQRSPDGGQSTFWYDRLGRLALSQNAKQLSNAEYSYTLYDSLGRITEVGELTNSTAITNSRVDAVLSAWINGVASTKEQITQTSYDLAYSPVAPELSQQNLRNRVSYSAYYALESDINNLTPTQAAATYYSYDILGNVDTLVHDYHYGIMNSTNNRFKKVVYNYDLQSGKVDNVAYQSGYADAFYHSYLYDAENRITNVLTSKDSVNWDNDAYYLYYLHGPLARTVLGDQQVQGINHAYTLQGWLKSFNPPVYDSATYTLQADGSSGSAVASNAYNLQLNYYSGDFTPISEKALPNPSLGTNYRPLYNGNISSMGVSIDALHHPLLYDYQYDQLNRLVQMNAYNSSDSLWTTLTQLQDFQENATYDPNGNILTYQRNGNNTFAGLPLAMDNLTYNYTAGTNKLDHIADAVPASNYPNDLDNQSAGNYAYDAIGELTQDNASGITSVTWTVYGKINTINKSDGSTIAFTYDPMGNRISKTYTPSGGSPIITWYVRDAQGNILSAYTAGNTSVNSGHLTRSEIDLYGAARLGTINDSTDVSIYPVSTKSAMPFLDSANLITFIRGKKLFELTNHLGNVLATISDKKLGISSDGSTVDHFNPQVLDANDYYPFGSIEPGRTYAAASVGNYRYGFNGQEGDKEINGTGNAYTAEFWEYDPRVGRRWNIDPVVKTYESPYEAFENSPLWIGDPRGQDSTQRNKAIKKAKEYVAKKDPEKRQYVMGDKGDPGECIDCSGLVSRVVEAGGEKDPNHGNETSGVLNIENNLTQVAPADVVPGNIVTYRVDEDYPYHTGLVISVVRAKDGSLVSFTMIHSSSSNGSIEGGPKETEVIYGQGFLGSAVHGFYKFDTKPDVSQPVFTPFAYQYKSNSDYDKLQLYINLAGQARSKGLYNAYQLYSAEVARLSRLFYFSPNGK